MKLFGKYKVVLVLLLTYWSTITFAQDASLRGTISTLTGEHLSFANIALEGTSFGTSSDENGTYTITGIPPGEYKVISTFLGYEPNQKRLKLKAGETTTLDFILIEAANSMDEIVVTGTLKEVNRVESPVPVEVYNPTFFQKKSNTQYLRGLTECKWRSASVKLSSL